MAARHRGAKTKTSSTVLAPASGPIPETTYPGKAVMEESKQSSKGFKKGGKVGQMADGGECGPSGRMDKTPRKARGGAATMRGRSPLSAANATSMPKGGTSH